MPPPPALPETSNYLPASTPGYTFRSDVPEVRLQFTVADEQGRLVQNLSAADVRVLDDQSPVPRFTDFERDDNLPLRLGIILDTSDSVKRVLPEEKTAALNFLDRVMRPQTDNAFVMAFGGNMRVWQTPTADRQQLTRGGRRLQQPGWGTRFFDALYSACADQLSAHDDRTNWFIAPSWCSAMATIPTAFAVGRRVAIAQRSEIQIYALTLHPRTSGESRRPDSAAADGCHRRPFLHRAIQQGFGRSVRPDRTGSAGAVLRVVPAASQPGFHALRVATPQKLEIHARQGYYAQ